MSLAELRERYRIAREQYEPTRATLEAGPDAYSWALTRLHQEAADAQGGLLPEFPEGCCDGSIADALGQIIAPDYMIRWAGAVVAREADGLGTFLDVREVPHHPKSEAAKLQAEDGVDG